MTGNIDASIKKFLKNLELEEKSRNTMEKYERDIHKFRKFLRNRPVSKEILIKYKEYLMEEDYKASSINSMLASVNKYLAFIGRMDCRVRYLKIQRCVFAPEQRVLSREDYQKLCRCSKGKKIHYIMNAVASTGIRISELQYFTVEAVREGQVVIMCKGKTRMIIIPRKLKNKLLKYAGSQKITEGIIFRSKSGKPIDRSSIWREMKKLSEAAQVMPQKVFPHNLRKLFARCFYKTKADISILADVLGHSSINTTRIYLISTGYEHRVLLESLKLVI